MERISSKILILLLCLSLQAFATKRYWVGGGSSTNWNATGNTNWSATSGGANNASVPSVNTDSVYFDGNSGAFTCSLSATTTIGRLDMTGATGTFSSSTSFTNLTIYGDIIIPSSITLTHSGTISGRGASGTYKMEIHPTRQGAVQINTTTGTYVMYCNLNINNKPIAMSAGTLNMNGYNITSGGLTNTSSVFTLNKGNSTITLQGNGAGNYFQYGVNFAISSDNGVLNLNFDESLGMQPQFSTSNKTAIWNKIIINPGVDTIGTYFGGVLAAKTLEIIGKERLFFTDFIDTCLFVDTLRIIGSSSGRVMMMTIDDNSGLGVVDAAKIKCKTNIIDCDYTDNGISGCTLTGTAWQNTFYTDPILGIDIVGGATYYAGSHSNDYCSASGWTWSDPPSNSQNNAFYWVNF